MKRVSKRVSVQISVDELDRLIESELTEQLEGAKQMYIKRRDGMGFAFKDLDMAPDLQYIDDLVRSLMVVLDYNSVGYDLEGEMEAWEQEKSYE